MCMSSTILEWLNLVKPYLDEFGSDHQSCLSGGNYLKAYSFDMNIAAVAPWGAWIEIYIAHVKGNRPAPTPQKGQSKGASLLQ